MNWTDQVVSLWITSIIWIGGLAVVFLGLTRFSPCNPGKNWWADRRAALTDLVYWLLLPLFTHLGRMLLLVAGVLLIYGNNPPTEWVVRQWPIWTQCICVLLVQDLILYWLHRLFHTPAGWRFHAIHHSPEVLDWTSTQRFHPVNAILEFAVADVAVLLLGFSPDALIILGPINLAYSVMVHANLNWTFGPLRYLLVSPVYHRWHHTTEEQGRDRNFASTFPILDLVFGTYYMPASQVPVQYGTTTNRVPRSFIGQLLYPLHGSGGWVARHPVVASAGGLAAVCGIGIGLVYFVNALETQPQLTPEQIDSAIAAQSPPPETEPTPAPVGRTIAAVAVSIRRSQVLLGGSDGTLLIRSPNNEDQLIAAHSQRVNAIALSSDDALMMTGGADGAARVWSSETGQLLRTFRNHETAVMSVAIATDGWAATGSAGGVVRLWNPKGELIHHHRTGVAAPVHAVAVSCRGRRAMLAQLSTANLWDPESGQSMLLKEQTELAYCVGLSNSGETAWTGGYDGSVHLWDAAGKHKTELPKQNGPIYSIVVSQDGERILTGGADKTVRVWQISTGRFVRELAGHASLVFAVSADATGKRIAAASRDGQVSVWEIPDGDVVPASAKIPAK
jgi:sterol desaturase/sphingolipid hydroxylase (fatty acid hydroxylase superfamily)/WD40 repeat protein